MTSLKDAWTLDASVRFLNHGSFGACPRAVLEYQRDLRAQLERQPVAFFLRDYEPLRNAALEALGRFVGARMEDLAFVTNATTGVNAVLRSLQFEPGDELLTTNHEYNACVNAMRYAASRAGANVTIANIDTPVGTEGELVQPILDAVTDRTRLAVLSHITSPTSIVFPMARLVREMEARGVDVLVDGAHAPGMIELDIESIGAAYYTGNCHKWMCAPKGAGFLHVRRDRQDGIVPTNVSHGYNSARTDRSVFRNLFEWTGTSDPTPWLSVPRAIEEVGGLVDGGWPEVRARNRELASRGAELIAERIGGTLTCPPEMRGSIASFTIPDVDGPPPTSALFADPLHDRLRDEYSIEVPVIPWPGHPKRLIRVSSQLYNEPGEYEALADALEDILALS